MQLTEIAALYVPRKRPGDYAQALMDLGATVCMPKNPKCDVCPLHKHCAAVLAGKATDYPRRAPKKAVPQRQTTAYVLQAGSKVLLRRRANKGLLASMAELPHEGLREPEALQLPLRPSG